ncbi:MAG: hypothetical protein ACXWRE_13435 [Pseudobdellovibrionaceae bacterium]
MSDLIRKIMIISILALVTMQAHARIHRQDLNVLECKIPSTHVKSLVLGLEHISDSFQIGGGMNCGPLRTSNPDSQYWVKGVIKPVNAAYSKVTFGGAEISFPQMFRSSKNITGFESLQNGEVKYSILVDSMKGSITLPMDLESISQESNVPVKVSMTYKDNQLGDPAPFSFSDDTLSCNIVDSENAKIWTRSAIPFHTVKFKSEFK